MRKFLHSTAGHGVMVAVIGEFDGFHRGHAQLVAASRRVAGEGTDLSAIVLSRASAEPQLTTLEQRCRALEAAGVARVTAIDATDDWATVERAIDNAVFGIDIALLACPADGLPHHSSLELRPLLARHEIETLELPRARDGEGRAITSALVRERLAEGAVQDVAALLARPYRIEGIVEHGDERGRTIGFPTMNVEFDDHAVWPAHGVYAGWTQINGERRASAINVGTRPTIYGDSGRPLLEAHVLDFDQDVYGAEVAVDLITRIRGEYRFPSLGELTNQLRHDVIQCRALLDHESRLHDGPSRMIGNTWSAQRSMT